jgi:hypothetical protein
MKATRSSATLVTICKTTQRTTETRTDSIQWTAVKSLLCMLLCEQPYNVPAALLTARMREAAGLINTRPVHTCYRPPLQDVLTFQLPLYEIDVIKKVCHTPRVVVATRYGKRSVPQQESATCLRYCHSSFLFHQYCNRFSAKFLTRVNTGRIT